MTKFASLRGLTRILTASPSTPRNGDHYYDSVTDRYYVYIIDAWYYGSMTTTTSTSSSTTTTSTSTTTTSTSTTTSSSTSTSTSTSTTTTL